MNFNPIKIFEIERLFSKGQCYAKQGNFKDAITLFDKALSINSKYDGIYLHKAFALSDMGRYSEALKCIDKSIELNPTNSVYYLFKGRIHYDHQNYDDSIYAIERSLKMESKNELALGLKGLVLLSLGEIEEGCNKLKEVSINLLNPSFQSRLLVFCESFLHKHEKIQMLQESEQAYLNKLLNHTVEAEIRIFSAILSLKLAEELCEKEKLYFWEKIELLVKQLFLILKIRKSEKNVSITGTDYLKWTEKFPPLINYYTTILRTYSEIREIREQLGKFYFEISSEDKIESNFKEIKKLMEMPSIITFSGILLYCLNRVDEGIEKLILSVEKNPKDYFPCYLLGQWYVGLGKYGEARNWFEKATENINPKIAQNRLNGMIIVWENTKGK